MKRANLVLHPELLDEVTRALAVKTYSAAVNLALADVLRLRKIQNLPRFFGQGLWQGDLGDMREDRAAGVGLAIDDRREAMTLVETSVWRDVGQCR
jgi:hypothetical protein